jgi:hypothetical protein
VWRWNERARGSFSCFLCASSRRAVRPSLGFSSAVVGGGDDQGVLLLLEHLSPLVGVPATSEYDYEVESLARQEYRLLRIWQPSAAAAPAEGKCFEVLHGLQAPCEKCPASRSETRRGQVSGGRQAPQDYLITSATLHGEDGALVSVRRVSSASFSAVMQARLDELAERAQLSRRERAVPEGVLVAGVGAGSSFEREPLVRSAARCFAPGSELGAPSSAFVEHVRVTKRWS